MIYYAIIYTVDGSGIEAGANQKSALLLLDPSAMLRESVIAQVPQGAAVMSDLEAFLETGLGQTEESDATIQYAGTVPSIRSLVNLAYEIARVDGGELAEKKDLPQNSAMVFFNGQEAVMSFLKRYTLQQYKKS